MSGETTRSTVKPIKPAALIANSSVGLGEPTRVGFPALVFAEHDDRRRGVGLQAVGRLGFRSGGSQRAAFAPR